MTEIIRPGLDITAVRDRFSSLRNFAFLDAPGGSQVPDEVGEAIARALREASANLGAGYATSLRVKAILEEAESKAARFLGCEPHEVIFGPNMTSLNFTLSRTAARGFSPGDEILVSSLDHDGGVAPWLEVAQDTGLVVRHVELNDDTTYDFDDLQSKLGPRTKVVAFAWASNAIGTVTDARRVCKLAHDVGALAWIDAVHYAAHEPIDVRDIGADVLLCSPYKFCGPHLGVAYGRTEVIERWRPYKARPAPMSPLGRRFETGTQSYELLAGFNAAIDYLDLDRGLRGDRPLRARAGPALPGRDLRRGHRLRAAGDGGPRADLPDQRRRRGGRGRRGSPLGDRDRGLGARLVVLAEPVPAPRATRTSRSASASSTTTPRVRSTG